MNRAMVLTLIGSDRPGLVEAVARIVAEHEGNWVESRLARLAGKFAGVLRIDVPSDRAEALRRELVRLRDRGLTAVVEDADASAEAAVGAEMALELLGHDRPGIVRDVSHAIAQRHVNVVELVTQVFSAPMSGEQMFKASARLRAPAGVTIEELRSSLEAIASELQVDLTLEPLTSEGKPTD